MFGGDYIEAKIRESVIAKILEDAGQNKIPGDKDMTRAVAERISHFVNISASGVDSTLVKNWGADNKSAFDSVTVKKPHYDQTRQRLENIIRTNPAAAGQSIEFAQQQGRSQYVETMGSLAANLNKDPKFAEIMIGRLEKDPAKLQSTIQDFAKARADGKVSEYIAGIKGEPAVTVTKEPKTDQNLGKKPQKGSSAQVPAPQAPSPSPATSATASVDPDQLTDVEIDAALKDPNNAQFAELVAQHNLRAKLKETAKSRPDFLKSLKDPGTMDQYVSLLKGGDIDGFLKKVGGIELQTASGGIVKMDDIMAQAKEGLGAMAGMFGGMLESFGFGGVDERKRGLFKGLLDGIGNDPVKTAVNARTEMGDKIGALLASSDSKQREYGKKVAKDMMIEHYAGHDQNTKYLLVGTGANLKMIGEIDNAFKNGLVVDIDHLKVELDSQTGKKVMKEPIQYKEAPAVQASAVPIQVQIAQKSANEELYDPAAMKPTYSPDGTFG